MINKCNKTAVRGDAYMFTDIKLARVHAKYMNSYHPLRGGDSKDWGVASSRIGYYVIGICVDGTLLYVSSV